MLERIRRLPSPALVISALALVIAIGGGGYALASLNSGKVKKIARKQADKEIKKKASHLSVAHAATATSAMTASQAVNASHAVSADSATNATNATNATTVGGETVKKFFMTGPASTTERVILHLDGLSISAGCSGGGFPIIHASSDTTDTQLKVNGNSGGAFSNSWSTSGGPTVNLNLVGATGSGSATGTYSSSDGHVVSFSYSYDQAPTYGSLNVCTVVGQAIGS